MVKLSVMPVPVLWFLGPSAWWQKLETWLGKSACVWQGGGSDVRQSH